LADDYVGLRNPFSAPILKYRPFLSIVSSHAMAGSSVAVVVMRDRFSHLFVDGLASHSFFFFGAYGIPRRMRVCMRVCRDDMGWVEGLGYWYLKLSV
jgi:hypothetical protein